MTKTVTEVRNETKKISLANFVMYVVFTVVSFIGLVCLWYMIPDWRVLPYPITIMYFMSDIGAYLGFMGLFMYSFHLYSNYSEAKRKYEEALENE